MSGGKSSEWSLGYIQKKGPGKNVDPKGCIGGLDHLQTRRLSRYWFLETLKKCGSGRRE